jgi:8-oxo-dGTP diphosphatase
MRSVLAKLLAPLWRILRGSLQWRILYWTNPKFIVGVAGVCLDHDGHVLLLEHRFWPAGTWGLPSGYAHREERFEQALQREVREETGLTLGAPSVVAIFSGYRLRTELFFTGTLEPGTPRPDGEEIVSAAFFDPARLPDTLLESHRTVVEEALRSRSPAVGRDA